MATTSPDSLRSPNPTDPYNLVADWAITTTDVQNALIRRANLYTGTTAQRTAFTTAPEGVHWQDTNGTLKEYVRQSGAWVDLRPDTGWVVPTLAAGLSSGANFGARRIGDVVHLRGVITRPAGAFTPGATLFTLPTNMRSPATLRIPAATYNGVTAPTAFIQTSTNGVTTIHISGSNTTDTVYVSGATFVVT